MRSAEHDRLTQALGIRSRELVALVGSGGKSGALQLLAREAWGGSPASAVEGGPGCDGPGCAGAGKGGAARARVLATTTTAMFLKQLQAIGPVLMAPDRPALLAALPAALAPEGPVSAARDLADKGKVEGLPPQWVDDLWVAGAVDVVLVEADGSRGLSLKAFGPREPQVPGKTTLIVQVAGLDALGAPLDDAHVHRVELLLNELGEELGVGRGVDTGRTVSPEVFVAAIEAQARRLRRDWPAARIVTLLNKAEDDDLRTAGLRVGRDLLEGTRGTAPEAVVVGSLQRREFVRYVPEGPLVSAVVLGAGRSRRMGSQKLLLPVAGRPMIAGAVSAATGSRAVEVIVVVGAEGEAMRAAIAGYPVRIVENPDYEQGMSTSLRTGLAAARPDCDAVLFALGDQPFVSHELIDRLITRFAKDGPRIVRPLVDGVPAHPVLMGAEYFAEILSLEEDVGAREILARHPDDVAHVIVADARSALDLDTPEDYKAATE